ncbi:hypothetical protein BGZ74_005501 [Mortierella antarctica]|nr:hypothetical protein BGZ74_005501 [Mortierella antarctica]
MDKQEYVQQVVNGESVGFSNYSGSTNTVDDSIADNLAYEMEHETKVQTQLDIEMAKAHKTTTEPPSRRWIVLATATLGALFVSLQGSALIVGLPDLMQGLDITFTTIIWVLLTYTLAITAVVPFLGYLGDAGLKGIRCRMFNVGFFIFFLGSLLCGLSQKKHTGYDLLGYRVIQGLGGGLLFSNCFAIVADKFYPYNQVGLASGIINIAFAAGTILGPVIGGATVRASWKWVFFFNLPFAAIGTIAGFLFCHDTIYPNVEYASFRKLAKTFDYTGFLSLTVAIVLLFMVVVSAIFPNGDISSDGALIGMGVAMGVLLVVFLVQSMWVRGDPLMAGILLIPFGLGMILAGFPSGRLADRIGFKYLCFWGLALASLATLLMPIVIDYDTNTWSISALLFVNGLGWGLYSSPAASISMLCILPQQRSSSSSLRIMFTMLSQMIAIVICFKVIINGMPNEAMVELFIYGGGIKAEYLPSFMKGFRTVCWITFGITLICCVCAWFLPVRPVIAVETPESEVSSVGGQKEEA